MDIQYNKAITPPEDNYYGVFETHTGLKYWRVRHSGKLGNQSSVITEDPSISMHWYSGGREVEPTYLYCYKGFSIGFFCQDLNAPGFPAPDCRPVYDQKAMTYTDYITDIGTFVQDMDPIYEHQAQRKLERSQTKPTSLSPLDFLSFNRQKKEAVKASFVTGLTSDNYAQGKRQKLESRVQQDEMIEIWLELFWGFNRRSEAVNLEFKEKGKYSSTMPKFTDQVLNKLRNGEFVK